MGAGGEAAEAAALGFASGHASTVVTVTLCPTQPKSGKKMKKNAWKAAFLFGGIEKIVVAGSLAAIPMLDVLQFEL